MAKAKVKNLEATPARSVTRKAVHPQTDSGAVYKSGGLKSVHRLASALLKVKAIDKTTMREYDELCLAEVPHFDRETIVKIREDAKLSQNVFAHYLNTSTSTVQKWETGQNEPSGTAAKLLQIIQKHGIKVLA
ncbi:hypothetical protein LMG28138_00760 [Pararobbsia alpina]|uniref:HTH cro/C1-type domain-containing protein n=2 Tax=Pararobbsia alpina TaxID=621374 RepID=A0A6S7AVP6_9BURK|nr:hypothetical protein LMG28138_00760 [Pararobbsia alpina]